MGAMEGLVVVAGSGPSTVEELDRGIRDVDRLRKELEALKSKFRSSADAAEEENALLRSQVRVQRI